MTREDIINMAAQAGIDEGVWFFDVEALERFAALVAAAEREACAKVWGNMAMRLCMMNSKYAIWYDDQEALKSYATAIRARGDK